MTTLWSLCWTVLSMAGPPSGPDARFEQVLRAIDALPAPAELARAFPDAPKRLAEIGGDPSRDAWIRRRAVAFLSYYPDAETRALLLALASEQSSDPDLRRIALYTLGRAFGQPGDRDLVESVASATADPDPRVARDAVRALRWVAHPMAEEALGAIGRTHPRPELRRLAAQTLARRR